MIIIFTKQNKSTKNDNKNKIMMIRTLKIKRIKPIMTKQIQLPYLVKERQVITAIPQSFTIIPIYLISTNYLNPTPLTCYIVIKQKTNISIRVLIWNMMSKI